MSLAYSSPTARLSFSVMSMSMVSVTMKLELRGSGEERSMGEPNELGTKEGFSVKCASCLLMHDFAAIV